MLTKREKKSYGAFNDYFLQECKVVTKGFDVTHIHVIKFDGIVPGIYQYKPKTGVLTLDEEFIAILPFASAKRALNDGRLVGKLLKHRKTWEGMIEDGLVKGVQGTDENWDGVCEPCKITSKVDEKASTGFELLKKKFKK
jgi:hypothetical protein